MPNKKSTKSKPLLTTLKLPSFLSRILDRIQEKRQDEVHYRLTKQVLIAEAIQAKLQSDQSQIENLKHIANNLSLDESSLRTGILINDFLDKQIQDHLSVLRKIKDPSYSKNRWILEALTEMADKHPDLHKSLYD